MNILEQRVRLFNEVSNSLSFAIEKKKQFALEKKESSLVPVIFKPNVNKIAAGYLDKRKVMELTLAFFANNSSFIKKEHSELLKNLCKYLCIKNKKLKKKIAELRLFAENSTCNNAVIVCQEKKLILSNDTLLMHFPLLINDITTSKKKKTELQKTDLTFRIFHLDQFSHEIVNISLEFTKNRQALRSIKCFDKLFKLYALSDYLKYDQLSIAVAKRVIEFTLYKSAFSLEAIQKILFFISDNLFTDLKKMLRSELDKRILFDPSNVLYSKFNKDLTSALKSISNFELCLIFYHIFYDKKELEFEKICLQNIAKAVLHKNLKVPFPLTHYNQEVIHEFSKRLIPHLLHELSETDLSLFLEVEKYSYFEDLKAVIMEVKKKFISPDRKVLAKCGNSYPLFPDLICKKFYKVVFGDRIQTSSGMGKVMGMGREKDPLAGEIDVLWIHLDEDVGSSYWSNLLSYEAMQKKGFKIYYRELQSYPKNIIIGSYLKSLEIYGVLPNEIIEKVIDDGNVYGIKKLEVKGMCEKGKLWIEYVSNGINYLSSFSKVEEFENHNMSIPLRNLENGLTKPESTLFRLLRALQAVDIIRSQYP